MKPYSIYHFSENTSVENNPFLSACTINSTVVLREKHSQGEGLPIVVQEQK